MRDIRDRSVLLPFLLQTILLKVIIVVAIELVELVESSMKLLSSLVIDSYWIVLRRLSMLIRKLSLLLMGSDSQNRNISTCLCDWKTVGCLGACGRVTVLLLIKLQNAVVTSISSENGIFSEKGTPPQFSCHFLTR